MLTRQARPVTSEAPPTARRGTPLETMLQRLPDQHREVLVATYFRGRTTREAAQVLGIAPATVQVRLYEAMRDLSSMLATDRATR
ncbi:sigma factor-like helix-turn-helix DNA-binding protein [Symbioplanes lichenis]|uniref:sigma factor-like helix-turn-helix DNA-binding protein n=1 Tax=Symbioplanes lichenis TaxID=1629072 RepID=UPI0027394272|nr:sigma factor-like helix-turn-helix DNA-binding protein [Actinoplanes lichenis]